MYIHIDRERSDGTIAVIARREARDRLQGKSFRGTSIALAGNFCRWNNVRDLFSHIQVVAGFRTDVEQALSEHSRTNSVAIDCCEIIGWSSTDDLSRYHPDDLERFEPNRKSSGLRVKLSRPDLRAPLTKLVTIVYELKEEGYGVVAIIHSVYPGRDIGELHGDVTERESCVFFDWSHPGQPI